MSVLPVTDGARTVRRLLEGRTSVDMPGTRSVADDGYYTGHYYLGGPGANGQLAIESILKRMDDVVEHSGPQLVHFHSHGQACGVSEHIRCDSSGNTKFRFGDK